MKTCHWDNCRAGRIVERSGINSPLDELFYWLGAGKQVDKSSENL